MSEDTTKKKKRKKSKAEDAEQSELAITDTALSETEEAEDCIEELAEEVTDLLENAEEEQTLAETTLSSTDAENQASCFTGGYVHDSSSGDTPVDYVHTSSSGDTPVDYVHTSSSGDASATNFVQAGEPSPKAESVTTVTDSEPFTMTLQELQALNKRMPAPEDDRVTCVICGMSVGKKIAIRIGNEWVCSKRCMQRHAKARPRF